MSTILRTIEEQVRAAHTALLVIDMQNDFCSEDGYLCKVRGYDPRYSRPVADSILRLVDAARRAGAPVVWLRSIYDFKYLADAHIAKRGAEGCCLEGSWGAEFFVVQPAPGERIIDKHTFSGFRNTQLDQVLRDRGVKTLLLTGVATNVCVESTLREGFFLGYNVVIAEDCVGSNNRAGHEGTLASVRTNFGHVADAATVATLLHDSAAATPA